VAKFGSVRVTHDTSREETHNLLSHSLTFDKYKDDIAQAYHVFTLQVLEFRGNSLVLRLALCLTHFRAKFFGCALESIVWF